MTIKIGLFAVLLLSSVVASAEFTPSPENKLEGRYRRTFVIDFGMLNQINETSDSKLEYEVLQDWQNFLSTAPISTTSDMIFGKLDNIVGLAHQFDSFKTIIDGEFKLPLLQAMIKTYREDLETLYTLAPHALKGRTSSDIYKDEIFSNKTVVYNCWLISSLSSDLPDICKFADQLIALNEADTEKLRMAFIRIIRVGSLQFNHRLCENRTDPTLILEQKKILEAKDMPKKYVSSFSFFGPSRELRSIPTLISKVEGPHFRICNGYADLYPLEHRLHQPDYESQNLIRLRVR